MFINPFTHIKSALFGHLLYIINRGRPLNSRSLTHVLRTTWSRVTQRQHRKEKNLDNTFTKMGFYLNLEVE
jgi:hypothetical protein